MGEDQLDDLDLDGPITLRILDGSAWNHPSKMMEDRDRELWQFDLELGHNSPHEKVGNEERRKLWILITSNLKFCTTNQLFKQKNKSTFQLSIKQIDM